MYRGTCTRSLWRMSISELGIDQRHRDRHAGKCSGPHNGQKWPHPCRCVLQTFCSLYVQIRLCRFVVLSAASSTVFCLDNIETIPVDRHHFNAVVDGRDLFETYLPVFKACVAEANGAHVMCSCASFQCIVASLHHLCLTFSSSQTMQ